MTNTNKVWIIIAAVVSAVILCCAGVLIGGAGGGEDAKPAETVTETETKTEPAPDPETVTETKEAPAPEPEPEPEETTSDTFYQEILNATWNELPPNEQDDLCVGWSIDKEMMLDAFMEGAEDSIPRSEVKTFFDGKCGA